MLVLVTTLILTGCGSDAGPLADGPPGPSPGAASATEPVSTKTTAAPKTTEVPKATAVPKPTERTGRGKLVTTSDSEYGTMLFDTAGQAIYLFDKEISDRPECYQGCAVAWPPVLTRGQPRANGQVKSDLLGTTARTDGSTQVTYAGHPLYYYIHDDKLEVSCHNVTEFGGVWLVVTPSGDPAA